MTDVKADAEKIREEIQRLTHPNRMSLEEAMEFYDLVIADCEGDIDALVAGRERIDDLQK